MSRNVWGLVVPTAARFVLLVISVLDAIIPKVVTAVRDSTELCVVVSVDVDEFAALDDSNLDVTCVEIVVPVVGSVEL